MKSPAPSDTPSADASNQARSGLLKGASEAAGASWAALYLSTLRASGRPIEGGWPGTLREARAQILNHLPRELLARGLSPLNAREIGVVASITNAEAKRAWQVAAKLRPSDGHPPSSK